jgi:exopolysaccharide synthesis protein ExoD
MIEGQKKIFVNVIDHTCVDFVDSRYLSSGRFPPPRIVSSWEGTEIKLSALSTTGHYGVAGDSSLDRHKAAHAEFAGAGGRHPSSTGRVRHYWLANVDLTPALFRHNHTMPWIAIDDADRLYDPRAIVLAVMAVQLIMGRGEPVFPHFIMKRRLPTKQLVRLGEHAIYVLKYLEKAVHPRWPMPFEATKRAVGIMVLLLTAVLLLMPVPLSNVAPAMVISLIAVAYIEGDGLLLAVSFLGAIILIGIASAAIWGTIVGAVFISTLW